MQYSKHQSDSWPFSLHCFQRNLKKWRPRGKYRANFAEKAFIKKARRPKPFLLAENHALRNIIAEKLAFDWSPEQISGWLKNGCCSNAKEMRVSHETIYKSLFIQTRGIFKTELKKHLRTKRTFRHAKRHRSGSRGQIIDAISISLRLQEVKTGPFHVIGKVTCS